MVISFPEGPEKKMQHRYAVFNRSAPATGLAAATHTPLGAATVIAVD
jgi:hypothetical protein